jgi:hypothetical protein
VKTRLHPFDQAHYLRRASIGTQMVSLMALGEAWINDPPKSAAMRAFSSLCLCPRWPSFDAPSRFCNPAK